MSVPTLDELRRYALARSLFAPTSLAKAIERLGFVQADPIRAPARAQDLTLRHRVKAYQAGDLERLYPKLVIDEDCLVNYGFLPRRTLALLHPRQPRNTWDDATQTKAQELLSYVQARGICHPRDISSAFSHGRTQGYWGNDAKLSTHLLDGLHYRGLLRVAGRDNGTRLYQAVQHPTRDESPGARQSRAQALLNLVLQKYAPLPSQSLGYLVTLLGYGAPDLKAECRAALKAARAELPQVQLGTVSWYWPDGDKPSASKYRPQPERVRFLAPFDPVVWDRRRFELFWGWSYKFEAYTPPAKRKLGHYALPLLYGEQIIGWANLRVEKGQLKAEMGYVKKEPRSTGYRDALQQELAAMRLFLGLDPT